MRRKAQVLWVILLAAVASPVWGGEFSVGVGTHIYGQDPWRDVELLRQLGANAVRDDLPWERFERERASYRLPAVLERYAGFLKEGRISPLIILAYGNPLYEGGKKPVTPEGKAAYARYAGAAARRLAGEVRYYEIWNEWDHGPEPKSPDSYFGMVKAAASAIKGVDPGARVLAGAATSGAIRGGWLERLVSLGVLDYADGISIHPYVHCEKDPRPETWIRGVELLEQRLRSKNDEREVPLFITEMGWPSHSGPCGSRPELAAQYGARALLLARTVPAVKGFWWYDLKNDGKDPENREHNFGLLTYDYLPKPAFAAFRDVAPIAAASSGGTVKTAPLGMKLLELSDGNGGKSFALWTDDGSSGTAFVTLSGTGPFRLLHAGSGDSAGLPEGKKFPLPVDGFPQIVTGVAALTVDSFVPSR
jgi:polysaccharide biosynthesis protein PslG